MVNPFHSPAIKAFNFQRFHLDLNQEIRITKPVFYHLNYGSKMTSLIQFRLEVNLPDNVLLFISPQDGSCPSWTRTRDQAILYYYNFRYHSNECLQSGLCLYHILSNLGTSCKVSTHRLFLILARRCHFTVFTDLAKFASIRFHIENLF